MSNAHTFIMVIDQLQKGKHFPRDACATRNFLRRIICLAQLDASSNARHVAKFTQSVYHTDNTNNHTDTMKEFACVNTGASLF